MSIPAYDFNIRTHTVFGAGSLNKLHEQELPGRKALLVISNGKSTRANGSLDRTIAQLEQAGVQVAVFDQIQANPLKDTVMDGAAAARDAGSDFIVALGGGSVMDASKAIALMATNPGDLWDYVQFGTGGRKPVENLPLPLVAITTTAGTGSETDGGGVITNPDTHEKTAVFDGHRLMPVLAIVDPELMLTVPPKFTAFQGFDALFHSTEGYIAKQANFMSDLVSSVPSRTSATTWLPPCSRAATSPPASTWPLPTGFPGSPWSSAAASASTPWSTRFPPTTRSCRTVPASS